MFSELFDAIRWGFGFAITIGIIILVVAIINAKKDAEEAERRRQIEEKEKRKFWQNLYYNFVFCEYFVRKSWADKRNRHNGNLDRKFFCCCSK